MSNINLYDSYKRRIQKFGINNSEYFRDSFVDAVNLVYSELNEMVFESDKLEPIGSFDDIIDSRLQSFATITLDETNASVSNRDFWTVEYELERTQATNGFTDTIGGVVVSILDNTISIAGDTVAGSGDIPDSDVLAIQVVSNSSGNSIIVNDGAIDLEYSLGDSETTQSIDVVTTHVISGVSGYELLSTRFLSSGSIIYQFLLDEGTGDTITDVIAEYNGTITSQVWSERYIEPSTSLDFRYRSAFDSGLDFHIQDGGQWGLEDDNNRERKWYGRGIKSARSAYQQLSTYTSPLGI